MIVSPLQTFKRVEQKKPAHHKYDDHKQLLKFIFIRTDTESVLALEPVSQYPAKPAPIMIATKAALTLATLIPSYPPLRPTPVL